MPARKTSEKTESSPRLPSRILSRILKLNIVYVLGFLLLISSFLIGVLVTKVSYLEKNGSGTISADDFLGEGAIEESNDPVDVEVGHLPALGNKDAKVKVIEFSDFQCPFCKSLFEDTLSQIKEEYIDTNKIAFYYRHFPLTSIHPNAQKAAEASECANEQGNFWGYHDQLFENQEDWESLDDEEALGKFVEYANAIGLDGQALSTCVSSGRFEDVVKADMADGNSIGVDGTPATYVNGYKVSGAVPFEEFQDIIDRELEK